MIGLPVGAHCPHILHTDPPPRLYADTVRLTDAPNGKRRLMIGGASDLEWEVLNYLYCPGCGTHYRASQRLEKVFNIVRSLMDPEFPLAPRLMEAQAESIRPFQIPRTYRRNGPHSCRTCNNTTFEELRPTLLIDKHVSSQLERLERHREICETLLNTYHYCKRCLQLYENSPITRMMDQQTFNQLLENVRHQTDKDIQATSPNDLLQQLILP